MNKKIVKFNTLKSITTPHSPIKKPGLTFKKISTLVPKKEGNSNINKDLLNSSFHSEKDTLEEFVLPKCLNTFSNDNILYRGNKGSKNKLKYCVVSKPTRAEIRNKIYAITKNRKQNSVFGYLSAEAKNLKLEVDEIISNTARTNSQPKGLWISRYLQRKSLNMWHVKQKESTLNNTIYNNKMSKHSITNSPKIKSHRRLLLTSSALLENTNKTNVNNWQLTKQSSTTSDKSSFHSTSTSKVLSIYKETLSNNDDSQQSRDRINFKEIEKTYKNLKYRIKTYIINMDTKWKSNAELHMIKLSNSTLGTLEFQSKIINDEISLVQDNILTYKVQYLSDKSIINIILLLDKKDKISYNKLLEKSIGLMVNISYFLLGDLDECIDNFIANPQSKIGPNDNKMVYDEDKEFIVNARVFNDCSGFWSACNQVYQSIITNDKDFHFSPADMSKITHFFQRLRFNLTKIICRTKTMFKDYNKGLTIIRNHKDKVESIKRSDKQRERYNAIIKTEGLDITKYKGPLELKPTDEWIKRKKIEHAWNWDTNQRKWIFLKRFDINSRWVDNILKYSTEEFRKVIFCERVVRRYKSKIREDDFPEFIE